MNAATEHRELLAETADKLFQNAATCEHAQLWEQIEASGMAAVLVPESAGGFGGGWEDAFVVLHAAGFHAVPTSFADRVVELKLLHDAGDPFALGALARAALMAGALSSVLRLCVQHANDRQQFGRPIGKFQAIQHSLAVLANETAAVNCAAVAACRAAERGEASFEIAAAKLRANRAAGTATAIAHQVHGAIGFTHEHQLHFATQLLWSCRSEYGNDRYWASRLGEIAAQQGPSRLWPFLTARSDA
jgi:acyl-CoA dehydrogenase